MIKRLKKIINVIRRKYIQSLMYLSSKLYMNKYVSFLREQGMDISGMPNYISNDVHFDGKNYSIIHLGDGCTISREVLFLTHDYSAHTVFSGLRDSISEESRYILDERDKKDKLLDLRGIYIGDHTFVGARSLLMPGTHIGNNCIVGGGTVAKGFFEDNTIIFGNPAKAYGISTNEWIENKAKKLMENEIK